MNEYLAKINNLLDQAADNLDAEEFDELLDNVGDEIDERRDGTDDEDEDDDQ